jgi:hypothetical protein
MIWGLYQSYFHCCDKIPVKINFRREEFILAHDFKGFGPGLVGLLVLWWGRTPRREGHSTSTLFISWYLERREKEQRSEMWYIILDDLIPPIRPHLPIAHSAMNSLTYECIDELMTLTSSWSNHFSTAQPAGYQILKTQDFRTPKDSWISHNAKYI